jgi:8-oxo-dGTP diphosphatase
MRIVNKYSFNWVASVIVKAWLKFKMTCRESRHAGLWEFPGGKIDPGESPEEALCREISEELSAEIRVVAIFDVVFYRYEWGPVLLLAYTCQLLTKTLHNVGVAEHRWVHSQELSAFPFLPADRPIIGRLQHQSACS